jgi:hypothetical protein
MSSLSSLLGHPSGILKISQVSKSQSLNLIQILGFLAIP